MKDLGSKKPIAAELVERSGIVTLTLVSDGHSCDSSDNPGDDQWQNRCTMLF
jgi:hypothetical protein